MVNPAVVASLTGSGVTLLAGLLTTIIRLIVRGFTDLKDHLTIQDTRMQALSERIARVEGKLEGTPGTPIQN